MPAGGAAVGAMTARLAVAATLLLSTSAPAAPAVPMIVVAASRNPVVSNMQAAYRPDDPQLVNRLVSLRVDVLSFDGTAVTCAGARLVRGRMSAGALFRQMFPDRVTYGTRHAARPAAFGVALAPTAIASVTRLRCDAARGGAPFWWAAALFPLGHGRWGLWLKEVEDHPLILRPDTEPMRASFDCTRAASPTERAICGDRLLAGWDRSVAAAYDQGTGSPDEQRAWLAERDRCGTDKACLHERMGTRAMNLLR